MVIAAGRFNPGPQSPEAPRVCVYALCMRNPQPWPRAGAFLAIHHDVRQRLREAPVARLIGNLRC